MKRRAIGRCEGRSVGPLRNGVARGGLLHVPLARLDVVHPQLGARGPLELVGRRSSFAGFGIAGA